MLIVHPTEKTTCAFFIMTKDLLLSQEQQKYLLVILIPMARPDEIKYKTIPNWKVKFNLDKNQVGKGLWQVSDNKAEYITEKITVQYINDDEGMRQNFIVNEPLSKSNSLKINFSIKTKLKIYLHGNQLQFFHKKTNVLNYEQLKVWDANGKPLEASIKKNKKKRYYIQVDTKNAVYPVTIDPLSTIPSWMGESNLANSYFGVSVSSAGDVNGDGYSDVVIGAEEYSNGEAIEGKAYVYHGSATGLSISPNWEVESNLAFTSFGNSVSSAGDVNGDGYSDIIVGASGYDNIEFGEGAAFVYHGAASGLSISPAVILETNLFNAFGGYSVSCAGDVNADGYSDVIVGIRWYTNGEAQEGGAFVYHGSSTGIVNSVVSIIETNQPGPNGGFSVSSAGDINADGYSDVIVGAPGYDNGQTNEGVALVCYGSASGVNTSVTVILETNQAGAEGGQAVSSAGDVNGDGYSDVMIGAPHYINGELDEGAAFVFHGSASGINITPAMILEGNQVTANAGWSLASAGDINADGYGDVIIGIHRYTNGQVSEGGAFVYYGSATGVNSLNITKLETNQDSAFGGWSVSSAGDVNGDGYSDIIFGAPLYTNGQTNEGTAFVYHGSAAGINTTAAAMMVESNNNDYYQMGYSVASAGDINGDGYSDVIVGAYKFDNGQTDEGVAFVYHGSATGINTTAAAMLESNQANAQMGYSVASAGDVNGDGYSDLIVGANFFDNGQTDEGGAFVYHGSATGINTTAAAMVESNQADAYMGNSVASAGDVNGDGYSDVIVGAPGNDSGEADEGSAFVYHGSAIGINTTEAAFIQSNQVNANMGNSVGSSGDVNGDGYSDVIVGAWYFDNGQTDEGVAFVYHGSATGINTTAAAMLEGNQVNAQMGSSVASAGDVNGDGYSDVIVGAPLFDNGEINGGAAFVYHGSATGINSTAAAIILHTQLNVFTNVGNSVASAGDVNGDGYSDVIVGAYLWDAGPDFSGAAFVHHGSATGINTTAAAMVRGVFSAGFLGSSVASAGDVNSDGYSDVIVGAPGMYFTNILRGGAFVYHGNSPGTNKRNNLRLYNTDLTTPINSSNFVFGNFGAGLFAKSFLGRVKGKMVWETRLNYNAYSGNPITNSTYFTAQQSAYTDLGVAGIELTNLIDKLLASGRYTKLRARVKYDPVTALTGQVYGPWRNVSAIIDANSLGALPVELISFKAAWLQKGKTAQLDFTTDKESGICCFDIEKSTDGFNFNKIGALPAKNTGGIQSYSFVDANATGKMQYYRLKIKGIAGKLDYSNIQQLQYSGATEILIFPNPTTDVLQLQLNSTYEKMNVQIINASGQIVKQLQVSAINQMISIPVQNLTAGKYWLNLQTGNDKQVLQFVKQ